MYYIYKWIHTYIHALFTQIYTHTYTGIRYIYTHTYTGIYTYIGEGNGNPLQCSCLENPKDRGAWWAAVCGVAQSQTWLKRLSSSSSRSIHIYKHTLYIYTYTHIYAIPYCPGLLLRWTWRRPWRMRRTLRWWSLAGTSLCCWARPSLWSGTGTWLSPCSLSGRTRWVAFLHFLPLLSACIFSSLSSIWDPHPQSQGEGGWSPGSASSQHFKTQGLEFTSAVSRDSCPWAGWRVLDPANSPLTGSRYF